MEVGSKHKAAYSEHLAIVFLLNEGYEVFKNVSQHGIYDLIAIDMDNDKVLRIDVKSANISKFGAKYRIKRSQKQISANVTLLYVWFLKENVKEIELDTN